MKPAVILATLLVTACANGYDPDACRIEREHIADYQLCLQDNGRCRLTGAEYHDYMSYQRTAQRHCTE